MLKNEWKLHRFFFFFFLWLPLIIFSSLFRHSVLPSTVEFPAAAFRQSLDAFPWDYKKNKQTQIFFFIFFSLVHFNCNFIQWKYIVLAQIAAIHIYTAYVSLVRCDSLNRFVLYCDQWTIPMFIYLFFFLSSCALICVCMCAKKKEIR